MSHSKLPWISFPDGQIQDENKRVIILSTGFSTKHGSAIKNAAFVVKAVNNHYRLFDELNAFTNFVSRQQDLGFLNHPEWMARVSKAMEVLKKAEDQT